MSRRLRVSVLHRPAALTERHRLSLYRCVPFRPAARLCSASKSYMHSCASRAMRRRACAVEPRLWVRVTDRPAVREKELQIILRAFNPRNPCASQPQRIPRETQSTRATTAMPTSRRSGIEPSRADARLQDDQNQGGDNYRHAFLLALACSRDFGSVDFGPLSQGAPCNEGTPLAGTRGAGS